MIRMYSTWNHLSVPLQFLRLIQRYFYLVDCRLSQAHSDTSLMPSGVWPHTHISLDHNPFPQQYSSPHSRTSVQVPVVIGCSAKWSRSFPFPNKTSCHCIYLRSIFPQCLQFQNITQTSQSFLQTKRSINLPKPMSLHWCGSQRARSWTVLLLNCPCLFLTPTGQVGLGVLNRPRSSVERGRFPHHWRGTLTLSRSVSTGCVTRHFMLSASMLLCFGSIVGTSYCSAELLWAVMKSDQCGISQWPFANYPPYRRVWHLPFIASISTVNH